MHIKTTYILSSPPAGAVVGVVVGVVVGAVVVAVVGMAVVGASSVVNINNSLSGPSTWPITTFTLTLYSVFGVRFSMLNSVEVLSSVRTVEEVCIVTWYPVGGALYCN